MSTFLGGKGLRRIEFLLGIVFSVFLIFQPQARGDVVTQQPLVEQYLISGELVEGEAALRTHLKRNPTDDEARFGLGTLQFIQAVEHVAQSYYKYGLKPNSMAQNLLPVFRLPTPPNPKPSPINYKRIRKVFLRLLDDLTEAEATLAKVQDPNVKLRLHFGQIHLDLDGNGKITEHEELWRVYFAYSGLRNPSERQAQMARAFAITFDKGDVHWLRGYCHLLMALDQAILAHDWKEVFNRTGHLLFPKVKGPYYYLHQDKTQNGFFGGSNTELIDFISMIHLINFPVKEKARLRSSLGHLHEVIQQSHQSWTAIEKETDDQEEWIPNPRQKGVIPGVRVSRQMIDGWKEFLVEAKAILNGKKLLPHWRVRNGKGVNLNKVFNEPTNFDLVMWMQGSAARPYLEEGTLTQPAFWGRMQQIFRGQFFGFAVWFN